MDKFSHTLERKAVANTGAEWARTMKPKVSVQGNEVGNLTAGAGGLGMNKPHVKFSNDFLAVSIDNFINRTPIAVDFRPALSKVPTRYLKVLETVLRWIIDYEVGFHDVVEPDFSPIEVKLHFLH